MIKQFDPKYMWRILKFENDAVNFNDWYDSLPKGIQRKARLALMNSIMIEYRQKIDKDLKYNVIIMFQMIMDRAIKSNKLNEKEWK